MLDAVRANLDTDARLVLADAGYRSEAVFDQLQDHPTESWWWHWGARARSKSRSTRARILARWPWPTRCKPRKARNAYRKRKWIAEPPNGWIKNVLGFRQFSMRGLHRVQAEFKLVCLALRSAAWLLPHADAAARTVDAA
jgi:hypothetical protein